MSGLGVKLTHFQSGSVLSDKFVANCRWASLGFILSL